VLPGGLIGEEHGMTFVRRYVETPGRRRGAATLAVLLTGGLVAAGTSVGGGFPFGGSGAQEPDLILAGGEILTMDPQRPRASAIAITDDEITAVGSSRSVARLAGRGTQTINLRGRTVIPGLVDGHTHAIRGGQTFDQETYWLDAGSLDEALAGITEAASEREPDEWVAVIGSWHPNQFRERRPPTVADLTEASPTKPVYVQYLYDYALVNEAGIEALGLNTSTTPPVPGIVVERDANGQATGRLLGGIGPFNTLVASILPATFEERKDSLEDYFTALKASGVTGLIDDSAGPAAAYEALFALSDEGRLPLRAAFRAPAQAPGNESAFFESLMAFRAPRERGGPTPFVGMGESIVFGVNDGVRMGPGFQATPEALAELEEVATLAASRRIPLEIHAYTDDAAAQILDVFERVNATHPIRNLRWAMAHLNTGSPETIARMKALGMAYSVQMGPYFEGPAILEANGPEVALRSAARVALDEGLVVAGGTDATRIGDYRVWPALEFHVTGASLGNAVVRPPDQRMTRMEALRSYTLDSAWLAFDDDDRGSLQKGKQADLAVLDAPYLRVPATRISEIRSLLTLRGGEAVYDRRGWLND
jgi:predicted amidohydrolase YtcJ